MVNRDRHRQNEGLAGWGTFLPGLGSLLHESSDIREPMDNVSFSLTFVVPVVILKASML